MSITNEFFPLFAPAIAAITGGIVTFIITVITKEQKTSEFRQAWIGELRHDIAEFIGLFITIHSIISLKVQEKYSKEELHGFLIKHKDDFARLETLSCKIKLRANPAEHTEFLRSLENLLATTKEKHTHDTTDKVDELSKKFTSESQALLKKEWVRVKKGEIIFRTTKWAAMGVFLISLLVAGLISTKVINLSISMPLTLQSTGTAKS